MGASSSKTAVAPILPATALSASQVAETVKALGAPYIPYAVKLEENGIDGAVLEAITTDDLPGLLADIGVTSSLHQNHHTTYCTYTPTREEIAPSTQRHLPSPIWICFCGSLFYICFLEICG